MYFSTFKNTNIRAWKKPSVEHFHACPVLHCVCHLGWLVLPAFLLTSKALEGKGDAISVLVPSDHPRPGLAHDGTMSVEANLQNNLKHGPQHLASAPLPPTQHAQPMGKKQALSW